MKRRQDDDWGPAIGSDPEKVENNPADPFKDTNGSLLTYFKNKLPTDAWGKLNSPINAQALFAGFRRLKNTGYTGDQIRGMIDTFIADIQRKPLPTGVAPWRAFLANLDHLSTNVVNKEAYSYDDIKPDGRL